MTIGKWPVISDIWSIPEYIQGTDSQFINILESYVNWEITWDGSKITSVSSDSWTRKMASKSHWAVSKLSNAFPSGIHHGNQLPISVSQFFASFDASIPCKTFIKNCDTLITDHKYINDRFLTIINNHGNDVSDLYETDFG